MDSSQKDIEIALRMLDTHRKVQLESYYRHREKRLAYRKKKYEEVVAKKKEDGTYRPRGRPTKSVEPI